VKVVGLPDKRNEDRHSIEGDSQIDRLFELATALAPSLLIQGDEYSELANSDNSALLLAGQHPGAAVAKPWGQVAGQPGAVEIGQVAVSGVGAVFSGIHFDARVRRPAGAQVTVAAGARVVFNNCRFTRPSGLGGNFVDVAAGGRAVFVGCTFGDAVAAGNVVNNAGLPAAVGIVGCYNATTRAHVNATVIFEV
jgi:hypothetical protein